MALVYMNDWAKLVKEVYSKNKKRAGYMLKDAMRDAKKLYKPVHKKTVKKTRSSEKKRRNKTEKGGRK